MYMYIYSLAGCHYDNQFLWKLFTGSNRLNVLNGLTLCN